MKKKILTGVLSVATVLSLATGLTGCDEKKVEITDDDDTLTILAWNNNGDIRNMVALFCQEKGYDESKIKIATCGDQGGDANTGYQTYLKGDGDADIMCLEADWILNYINDDDLTVDLAQLGLSTSSFPNAYSYTIAIGTNSNGVLKGASFQAAPGGFVYRADLAEQYLGVKTPEEMQELVKDWESFEATAKRLKEANGPALTATEDGMWQVFQANRTKPWVENDTLQMDNAEDFYDLVKRFYDNGYVTTDSAWSNTWYSQVKNGNALGEFLSTWGMVDNESGQLGNFTDKEGDNANMAFCAGPQEYFWGGTWLGVSTKCNSKTLAKEFIEFFTVNDDTMRKYTEATGDYCNNKKVMQDVVNEGTHSNKYLVGGQSQFDYFLEKAGNIKMDGLITEYDSTIKAKFNDSVKDYAEGKKTKEEAIASFKEEVRKAYVDLKVE